MLALLAAACLPSAGPEHPGVARNASTGIPAEAAEKTAYAYVKLDGQSVRFLGSRPDPRFSGLFGDRQGPPRTLIGAGDILAVTVFEAAPGGLFTPPTTAGARPGNFVELPPQTVGRDGLINVPYAGSLDVVGKTTTELERMIEERLRNRAIEPQVVVTFRDQRSAQVSILGEVTLPTKVSLNPQGERMLDVIARGGGPKFPAYETTVTLQRGKTRATTSMKALIDNPANNIFARGGDIIYVHRTQRSYTVVGATGKNGQFFFDADTITAATALGKGEGLLDDRAEPGAVFLYRMESRQTLEAMGVDTTPFKGAAVPTVYAIDLRDPGGMFLAQKAYLQDGDVVFVANAISVDITKMLNFVRVGIATVNEGANIRHPFVFEAR